MGLMIDAREFSAAAGMATRIVERSAGTLPVLANVLVRRPSKEGGLELLATDQESLLTVQVPGGGDWVSAEGVCVPAQALAEWLATVRDGEVSLEVERNSATVRQGRDKVRLMTIAGENFPRWPAAAHLVGTIRMEGARWGELLSTASWAVAARDHRRVLLGLLMEVEPADAAGRPAEITVTGADGKKGCRLVVSDCLEVDMYAARASVVLPRVAWESVAWAKGGPVVVTIEEGGRRVRMRQGAVELTVSALEGKFPDLSAVLPKETTTSVRVRSEDVELMLKRAAVACDDKAHAVVLKLAPGEPIEWRTRQADLGEGSGLLAGSVEGVGLEVAFSRPLMGELSAALGGEWEWRMKGPAGPSLAFPTGERWGKVPAVLMPIAIQHEGTKARRGSGGADEDEDEEL